MEIKMKILYGTGNPAKLNGMRKWLQGLEIEIIGLNDIDMDVPVIEEDGNTPLENARKKALGYYNAFHMPVFSCDSGLYIDNIPEDKQPGVHVRTVGGKYLTDEEMIEYYAGLAEEYGDLKARYKNAICLVTGDGKVYDAMDENMASEPFIITCKPHKIRKKGFPLDSLSIDIKTGKYYYDLEAGESDNDEVSDEAENGFVGFFRNFLPQMEV